MLMWFLCGLISLPILHSISWMLAADGKYSSNKTSFIEHYTFKKSGSLKVGYIFSGVFAILLGPICLICSIIFVVIVFCLVFFDASIEELILAFKTGNMRGEK